MYHALKPIIFKLSPETAHHIALKSLTLAYKFGIASHLFEKVSKPVTIFGLEFKNSIGLAAGFDKDAEYIDELACFGFGFLEVGTTTPIAQPGNPKPRLFRLAKHKAIINRMGFNNKGADELVKNVAKSKYKGILGINIGKGKNTPKENAIDDYVLGFKTVCNYASYVTVNVSSPNTVGLRDLQAIDELSPLLCALKEEQTKLVDSGQRYVPLVLKIAPDLADDDIKRIADLVVAKGFDGIIATNTTISREAVKDSIYSLETGGLSGLPLTSRALFVVRLLTTHLENKIPVIGSGGIMSVEHAIAMKEAGARAVQVYTGLIYEGPTLISKIAKAI